MQREPQRATQPHAAFRSSILRPRHAPHPADHRPSPPGHALGNDARRRSRSPGLFDPAMPLSQELPIQPPAHAAYRPPTAHAQFNDYNNHHHLNQSHGPSQPYLHRVSDPGPGLAVRRSPSGSSHDAGSGSKGRFMDDAAMHTDGLKRMRRSVSVEASYAGEVEVEIVESGQAPQDLSRMPAVPSGPSSSRLYPPQQYQQQQQQQPHRGREQQPYQQQQQQQHNASIPAQTRPEHARDTGAAAMAVSSDSDEDISHRSLAELNALLKKENYKLSLLTTSVNRTSRKIGYIGRLLVSRASPSSSSSSAAPSNVPSVMTDAQRALPPQLALQSAGRDEPADTHPGPAYAHPHPPRPVQQTIHASAPTYPAPGQASRPPQQPLHSLHSSYEQHPAAELFAHLSRAPQQPVPQSAPRQAASHLSDPTALPAEMLRDSSSARVHERYPAVRDAPPSYAPTTANATPYTHSKAVNSAPATPVPDVLAEWKYKTSASVEILSSLSTHSFGGLGRKPRSLLLPPASNSALSEIAVTSTLGGQIQSWNIKSRRSMYVITDEVMRNGWAEDMCWIGSDILGVSPSVTSEKNKLPDRVPHQVALIYNCRIKRSNAFVFGVLDFQLKHLNEMPHDKGVSTIAPMSSMLDKTRWLTGGLDRKIFLWSFDSAFKTEGKSYNPISTLDLHHHHTSAIYSIYHESSSNVVYSGGADSRLIAWSLETSKLTMPNVRHMGPIRDVLGVPNCPSLLMVSFMDKDSHIRLVDLRTNQFVLSLTAGDDTATLGNSMISNGFIDNQASISTADKGSQSRYQHASIHPNGFLVAMGQTNGHKLNIWDMRYNKVNGPTQVLTIHENKILHAKFYNGAAVPSLLTISSDNTFMATEYRTSNELQKA
ncbi:WD40-repeat-containing domain protein [Entophlyctis helioformis]|nr:WD40-repeat-containing domain protein [Entophlyctis helioformis]